MYLVLYRKYRPEKFYDVLSQDHITTTLLNQVKNNKIAHAYLFTGSRGTGKTTCAKILALAANCTDIQNGNPCLKCQSCISILNDSNLDVVEIDAASNNGVDNIRQLREEALYLPVSSKYRIYIIDETHMLSNGAFNALLKIMEEPPSHCIFILATTEINKVPATILSRCQRFDFHRIKIEDLIKRIKYIAENESISITDEAAQIIASLCDGGMRDAISLLDRCLAFSNNITKESIIDIVGITPKEYLYSITDYILNNNCVAALELLNKLYNSSKDIQSFCEELIVHFRNLLIIHTGTVDESIIKALPDEIEKLKSISKSMSLTKLIEIINILQETLDNLSKYSDKRLCIELCMIKLTTKQIKEEYVQKFSKPQELVKNSKENVPINSLTDLNQEDTFIKKIKNENIIDENTPIILFDKWADVLEHIKNNDAQLYSLLYNATAYVQNDILYIESPMTEISDLLKRNGNVSRFVKYVEEVTDNKYKLRLKKTSIIKEEESNESMLNELEKTLIDNGIQVNIK